MTISKRDLRNARRYAFGKVPKGNAAMACVAQALLESEKIIQDGKRRYLAIQSILDEHDSGWGSHRNRETYDLVRSIRNALAEEST